MNNGNRGWLGPVVGVAFATIAISWFTSLSGGSWPTAALIVLVVVAALQAASILFYRPRPSPQPKANGARHVADHEWLATVEFYRFSGRVTLGLFVCIALLIFAMAIEFMSGGTSHVARAIISFVSATPWLSTSILASLGLALILLLIDRGYLRSLADRSSKPALIAFGVFVLSFVIQQLASHERVLGMWPKWATALATATTPNAVWAFLFATASLGVVTAAYVLWVVVLLLLKVQEQDKLIGENAWRLATKPWQSTILAQAVVIGPRFWARPNYCGASNNCDTPTTRTQPRRLPRRPSRRCLRACH